MECFLESKAALPVQKVAPHLRLIQSSCSKQRARCRINASSAKAKFKSRRRVAVIAARMDEMLPVTRGNLDVVQCMGRPQLWTKPLANRPQVVQTLLLKLWVRRITSQSAVKGSWCWPSEAKSTLSAPLPSMQRPTCSIASCTCTTNLEGQRTQEVAEAWEKKLAPVAM